MGFSESGFGFGFTNAKKYNLPIKNSALIRFVTRHLK